MSRLLSDWTTGLLILWALLSGRVMTTAADQPGVRVLKFHGYTQAIEISHPPYRAILSPQAGGRVLQFSADGRETMYLDDAEKNWQPGAKPASSAGRFDFGPELVVPAHPKLWSGDWTSEVLGPASVRLISPKDDASGVQLIREFSFTRGTKLVDGRAEPDDSLPRALTCQQRIINISKETRELCHWGRSFSPGGGICLVPLKGASRFPSKYAMYEDSAIINVRNTDDLIRERDGFLEIVAPPRKPKLGFDSQAGWLAYVMRENTLFVKRFAVYPDRPYNEAAGLTLSVWYPSGPRIELEPIGPRERLLPGESATFAEHWYALPFQFPREGEALDLLKLRAFVMGQIPEIGR